MNITDLSGLGELVLGEHREDSRHITALATMQEASLKYELNSKANLRQRFQSQPHQRRRQPDLQQRARPAECAGLCPCYWTGEENPALTE